MPDQLDAPIAPSTPGQATRWGRPLDRSLLALVLGFAFLSGSFVARNSDLWLHRATGRLIASGDYRFGTDPFAYTTEGHYWANHAWLFDLGLHHSFQAFGDAAVVALKAAVVVLIAAAMILAARNSGPLWLSAACVLCAVLAMSPRLLLQPTIGSFLLLAVCLGCLRNGGRALVAVPVLIALWVNLDSWFILGPLLVVLFWIGRRLDRGSVNNVPWPGWFVPVSLLACLVSPHHVHALRLPMELSPTVWRSEFANDSRFAGLFASPWNTPLLASGGYNLASWAFFILLALGVASFASNRRAVRSWRGPVWLAFALLAAWQARLIPFFAVVAGPITALNFGECMSRRSFPRLGRAFGLLATLSLGVLGWFGLLNGFYNHDRGVGWAVHTDPTLERTALAIAESRKQNQLPPASRVFIPHPDLSHYLAWFAPGERCFLDSRLTLFTDVAADNAALARAMGLLPAQADERNRTGELLDAQGIVAVVLYDPDSRRMTSALRELTTHSKVWRVVGGAVLVVPKASAPASPRLEPERLAFQPPEPGDASAANEGPANLAEPSPWWEPAREFGRHGSWEADAATVYLRLFEGTEDRSPALPLLAVRAARRGIEVDPKDATAWLMLARAALLLDTRTWERDDGDTLSPLAFIRHVQVATGLRQATLLDPDLAVAHETLAGVFARRRFFDLAHRHAAEHLRLLNRVGRFPGETSGAFAERLRHPTELAKATESLVQDGENRFLIRTAGLAGDPLARAGIAAELGLPQKAIDVLRFSHPDLYGPAGLSLLLDLLLQTGQAPEARVLLERAELRRNPDSLGVFTLPGRSPQGSAPWAYRFPTYDWFDFSQCAAVGRYSGAAAAIERLRHQLEKDERAVAPANTLALARQVTSETGFALPPANVLSRLHWARERARLSGLLAQLRFLSVARGDLAVLGGVLELERGNPSGAAERFRVALALYAAAKELNSTLPGEPLARRYLHAIERAK